MKIPKSKLINGFTLIELLIVIAVASVIFAFSMPYAMNFYQSNLINEAQNNIVDALQRAGHNAALQKNDSAFGVKIDNTEHKFFLFQGSSYASRVEANDEEYDIVPEITVTGETEIVFAKMTGLPSVTGTTTLTYGNFVREIYIEEDGEISTAN